LERHALMEAIIAVSLMADGSSPGWNRTDMVNWPRILGFVLFAGAMLLSGPAPKVLAATSATLDIISDDADARPGDTVEIGGLKPIPGPNRNGARPLPSGNPLWAVPLSVLTATRERPIFSPSRRPQPPATPAAAPVRAPVAQKPAAPERPPLALVGAVVGESDAIAVFLDQTRQSTVRLRQGESYAGWLLSAVLPREVTFKKADRTEILVLKHREGQPASPAAPHLVVPTAGSGTSFAPFVPRSTPKNGESDGL
jgi:general secretion pathway protein N